MNTGQMMITVAAIFLLTLVIMRVTTNLLTTDNAMSNSKVGLMAVSLATSMMEEATGKAFDNNTDNGNVTVPTSLTAVANLGPESGESYIDFNDFDDFNFFKTTPKIDSIEVAPNKFLIFQTFCRVDYVNELNPMVASAIQTWHKKLNVKVTSDAMRDATIGRQDTLKMSTVFSYWYFR
ncbi:MAG: hypothetical protein CVV24_07900 [Ignavibacteriae bacterium HGW-Ignavibacteriae-3]|nr:MAG: hypothetical protein CVV24_07900 [Ignavibacteriae bacterium HGW-Ignavibacteriae-3]